MESVVGVEGRLHGRSRRTESAEGVGGRLHGKPHWKTGDEAEANLEGVQAWKSIHAGEEDAARRRRSNGPRSARTRPTEMRKIVRQTDVDE